MDEFDEDVVGGGDCDCCDDVDDEDGDVIDEGGLRLESRKTNIKYGYNSNPFGGMEWGI